MTRRHRISVTLLTAVLLATGLSACGSPDKGALGDLEAAISKTERLSRRYHYIEVVGDRETAVRGLVEDDFRYDASVQISRQAAMKQVVSDDTIATRLQQPDALGSFAADLSAAPPETVEALRSKRWVVDPVSAPSLLLAGNEQVAVGSDPVFDALTVFRYLGQVLRQQGVRKFDENSLEYRPKEDPFPKPAESSDVERYDFVRPRLPRSSDLAGGANQAVPGSQHFRKMSVYVRDGIIIRVLEDVDVVDRLDDLRRNYAIEIDESRPERSAAVAIDAINEVRQGQGLDLIRVRTMSYALTDHGKDLRVELPTEDVVAGDLSFLKSTTKRRRAGQGQAGATTSTSVAPGP